MKKLIIGLLFIGGFLMAQQQTAPPQQATEPQQTGEPQRLSYDQRLALRSQSPPVLTSHRKNANKHPDYRVTENKTTITAFIPYGK